jgi:hypothetical protein
MIIFANVEGVDFEFALAIYLCSPFQSKSKSPLLKSISPIGFISSSK